MAYPEFKQHNVHPLTEVLIHELFTKANLEWEPGPYHWASDMVATGYLLQDWCHEEIVDRVLPHTNNNRILAERYVVMDYELTMFVSYLKAREVDVANLSLEDATSHYATYQVNRDA